MANSDFWRALAISFQSVPEIHEFTAYRQYYAGQRYFLPTSITEPTWELQATQLALAEFRPIAIRGATVLPSLPTSTLVVRWLEALWEEATEGPIRQGIPIVGGNRIWSSDPEKIVPPEPIELRGKIDRVFQTSSALCRKLEADALQSEFEENKQNDPRNWSPLRANFEAFRAIKELHARPPERIPESLVRRTIADQIGVKPEEVTPGQINFAVASLVPFYSSVELIPDVSPGVPEATPIEQSPVADDGPKENVTKPIAPPAPKETIAEQIERLRGECGLTIPKLAEAVRIDPRTVDRHLAGESIPYPRTISAYERVFSKHLKRQVAIKKMP